MSPGTPEEVRLRLIGAAVAIASEAGVRAVTVATLARRADISQSGFYHHFKNVDECLGVAALHLASQMRVELRSVRDRLFSHITAFDQASLNEQLRLGVKQTIEYALERPGHIELLQLFSLFARFRSDTSPFGAALHTVNEQVRADVASEILLLARRFGLDDRAMPLIRTYAHLAVSIWEDGVVLLITEPSTARAVVIDMVADAWQAMLYRITPAAIREQMDRSSA